MSAPEQLQSYLEREALLNPDATAVTLALEALTYGQIEGQSTRLARLLVDHGCGPGDRICLVAAKSPRVVVAMHATLKAGCCYVPVDSESPAVRVERIVR